MKAFASRLRFVAALGLVFSAFTGCESTDGGSTNVSGSVYYGMGFYDPWYYGSYDNDLDIIVTPPDRPTSPPGGITPPPRPTHPIAPTPSPRPAPMPSIPSTPRAMPRGGGRR